ncbi:hypothetical protein [Paracoccus salsus]|uniref:hypothetical protein n=1 Tax=Paracoccus salsus TaxID=2911061 RepID=UPI001F3D581E|nr:hypothetical protein [Paracoccus salsus]MCF3972903.1 hypothetical protein [Paracoccus salsus]
MSDARSSQNAARLSEDIGDVLGAIRRLIAEDESLGAARDRLNGDRRALSDTINEDAGEFLARRYGGNAALARRLAHAPSDEQASMAEAGTGDEWPLGDIANAPSAARPKPVVPETPIAQTPPAAQRIMRHSPENDAELDAARPPFPAARNDLARSLSATSRAGESQLRDTTADVQPRLRPVPSPRDDQHSAARVVIPPLRLNPGQRIAAVPKADDEGTAGWRNWLRSAPQGTAVTSAPQEVASVIPATAETRMAADVDFAEDFDWKARMRPDIAATWDQPARAVARPADDVQAGPLADEASKAAMSCAAADHLEKPGCGIEEHAATDTQDAVPDFADVLDALDPVGSASSIPPVATASATATAEQADVHDTVTGLAPAEEEQCIRDLLREMIQEELHGELGERFSRNLRAVIRREVSAAIDDQLDRI